MQVEGPQQKSTFPMIQIGLVLHLQVGQSAKYREHLGRLNLVGRHLVDPLVGKGGRRVADRLEEINQNLSQSHKKQWRLLAQAVHRFQGEGRRQGKVLEESPQWLAILLTTLSQGQLSVKQVVQAMHQPKILFQIPAMFTTRRILAPIKGCQPVNGKMMTNPVLFVER
jgi:hypothetical protein